MVVIVIKIVCLSADYFLSLASVSKEDLGGSLKIMNTSKETGCGNVKLEKLMQNIKLNHFENHHLRG